MKQIVTLIFLIFSTIKANSQNCPQGYEERNVICNGIITKKCVPINYTCKGCWTVQSPNCSGDFEKGCATTQWGWHHDSYNLAEQAAQKMVDEETNKRNSGSKCATCDFTKYRIFLLDSKYCNTEIDGNAATISDIKSKALPFLQRMLAEIVNYKRYVSGLNNIPGATITEFRELLDQGESNANKLQTKLDYISDNSLDEVQSAFNNLKQEEQKITSKYNEIVTDSNNKRNQSVTQTYIDRANNSNTEIQKQMNLSMAQINATQKGGATQQQLDELNRATENANSKNSSATTVGDVVVDVLVQLQINSAKKDDANNLSKHSKELKNSIETKNGELINCSHCNGNGRINCDGCNGKGYKSCAYCSGSGSSYSKTCAICKGTGKSICTNCYGLATTQCKYCYGVGKEFKEQSTTISNSNSSFNDNLSSKNKNVSDFNSSTVTLNSTRKNEGDKATQDPKILELQNWILDKLRLYSGKSEIVKTFAGHPKLNATDKDLYSISGDNEKLMSNDIANGIWGDFGTVHAERINTIYWKDISKVEFKPSIIRDYDTVDINNYKCHINSKSDASIIISAYGKIIEYTGNSYSISNDDGRKENPIYQDRYSEFTLQFDENGEPNLSERIRKAFNDLIEYYKKNKPKELY